MAVRKRRSKLWWIFLSIVLLLVLVIAALPVWFPWALRPIAKRYGASYANYHRVGYQRFELSGFALTNGAVNLNAGEVMAFVPTVWLWRHLTGTTNEPFLQVQSWKYVSAPAKSSKPKSPPSVYSTFGVIRRVAAALDNWLPTATLTNGTITVQDRAVDLPQAVWANGNLTATVSLSNTPPITIAVSAKQAVPWKLNLDSEAHQFHSAILLDDGEGKLTVSGTINWLTNQAELAATFPPHGFIPDTASLRADSFDVPATFRGLTDYRDFSGAVHAEWHTNHFKVQLTAKAAPQSTNVPPLDVELRVAGDTNAARLEMAQITIPGLQAELPAPVAIRFQPPFLSEPATLNLAADLDQQHWFVAQGRLAGRAIVYPAEKLPRVSFVLSGTGVTTTSVTTSNLEMNGELDWPVLDLKSAHVLMDDGSQISVAGLFDLKEKIIRDGRLQSSGAFGGQFLPAGFSFASASVNAQFGGPLDALTNSAKLVVKHLVVPRVNPVDVEAEGSSEGLNFKAAQIKLTAGSSSLLLRGSAAIASENHAASISPSAGSTSPSPIGWERAGVRAGVHGEDSLTLTAFELSQSNRTVMQLQKPVRITFRPNRVNAELRTNASWALDVEPVEMSGDSRNFRLAANVSWPERGTFQCQAEELDARLLEDFVPQADVEATLSHLDFSGGWTNGPLAFQLTSAATLKTKEQLSFSGSAKLTAGKTGLLIEQLSISSATQAVCRAEGSLPIFFDPTQKDQLIQIDTEAALKLQMLTDPKSILWEKIAAATGLRLQEPNLRADLEGTWAAPKGEVTVQVRRVELSGRERPLPSVENLDFAAVMDRTSARISRFNFEIEKQPVSLTGQIPLGESFWSGLRHKQPLPDWHEATAHLKMEKAQLAAFTSFMPQILSPEGTATADVSLEPGGNFHGELSVTNARTYPLESIGPVRNIQLLARLDGRNVLLENASAEIGGQRVNLDGGMEINEQWLRTNGLPPFHVHLNGTNVPLARNPSILLRADLNLAATNSGLAIPVVSGKVRLRDSLYLADLQSLVPERTASPRQRPPYFSVEAEPWAHWRLKVNVQGDGFLRVQTPLFRGKVSTILTLEGTLKEPLALGHVKIDPGSVIAFPFSSLDVKQGFISLTSEDPYRPNLYVTAEARRFGYDVKMEATGPVDQPVVQFTSIPGLSSEEIVLMLTAGQIPRGVGVTATTQQRAQGLGLFVGKNLLSDFGLGGNGADRLTIRSGEEISQSGRQTYDLEYKLTDRWSVIGEYDRFDQYNLNLKWKVYSK